MADETDGGSGEGARSASLMPILTIAGVALVIVAALVLLVRNHAFEPRGSHPVALAGRWYGRVPAEAHRGVGVVLWSDSRAQVQDWQSADVCFVTAGRWHCPSESTLVLTDLERWPFDLGRAPADASRLSFVIRADGVLESEPLAIAGGARVRLARVFAGDVPR